MSSDFQNQLENLRRRMARIDRKYQATENRERRLSEGKEVLTEAGKHWEVERHWPVLMRHGTADIGALTELPPDFLQPLLTDNWTPCAPIRWCFLDTETTGVAGGSGTVAFLTGVGWIAEDGFRLRQYFMRDMDEEASVLTALTAHLNDFDVLVTYNGRAYDQPLLETRYRLSRLPIPFSRLRHLDLLFAARRLWRLALERCRLVDLESRILGYDRVGDVDGAWIPELYFQYLRSGNAARIEPVLTHNAWDILSLACLTAIVPVAFRDPAALSRPAELVSLARWLRNEGRLEEALDLMRRAVKRPLAEELLYATIWHIADIERKLGRHDAAVAAWAELTTISNAYRAQASERLAIFYEHREKNHVMALEFTRMALEIEPSEQLKKREARLARRVAQPRTARLL